MNHRISALVFLLALPLAGCPDKKGAVPPPATPEAPAPSAHPEDPAAKPQPDAALDTGGLHVSDAIAKACGLPRAHSAPKFDFDSASLAPEDRDILGAIARCVVDGALRGKSLALVGRTDPRGESEYNLSLGESRADTVERYLHDLGVGRERLIATSRGKLDAKGTDESSWAEDRRVDIELASR